MVRRNGAQVLTARRRTQGRIAPFAKFHGHVQGDGRCVRAQPPWFARHAPLTGSRAVSVAPMMMTRRDRRQTLSIYVTVAGDPKTGDPSQVREKLEKRYEKDPAAYAIDIAFLPGQGYVVSSATRRAPLDPSISTDRTGPFKLPPAVDVTDEVRAFLAAEGIALFG
jgi:hypothetical protein